MVDRSIPDGVAYVDGAYVPMTKAKISVLDWGFLRSDVTYDVVHVWKGRFFQLGAHIDQFCRSIDALQMKLPFGRDGLVEVLRECVRRAGHPDAYVEMILTRGMQPLTSRDPRDAINNFIAFSIPFRWIVKPEDQETGINLVVSAVPRIPPESVDPAVKNFHWLDFVAGLFDAFDKGGDSVALVDGAGNVTEGPGFNIFVVKDGAVATPSRGVLHGITRMAVLRLSAELGVPAEPRTVSCDELAAADEVFLTSTAGGVMPATRINGAAVGEGAPGPLTRRIKALYWDKHADPDWSEPAMPAHMLGF